MLKLLHQGAATAQDIAEHSGLSEQSVRDYLRAMRKRRIVYVARWEHDRAGRQTLAAYSLGSKADAQRVPPRSRAEIAKHYRARKRMSLMLGVRA
jgi:predicted ArsR family transcriptional regulator